MKSDTDFPFIDDEDIAPEECDGIVDQKAN
jgi:hypothetical protein